MKSIECDGQSDYLAFYNGFCVRSVACFFMMNTNEYKYFCHLSFIRHEEATSLETLAPLLMFAFLPPICSPNEKIYKTKTNSYYSLVFNYFNAVLLQLNDTGSPIIKGMMVKCLEETN
jgi:hypothetical protein